MDAATGGSLPQRVGGLPPAMVPADAASGLAGLLDEWSYGVLLATADARLLHATRTARQVLARPGALALADGRLLAADPEQQKGLVHALVRGAAGLRSLLTLADREDRSLTLAVVPLRSESGQPARVALVLSRPSVCDALMLCFFARSHGLTGAEEQVLAILCQGYSAPQAAAQLKVAVSTVRSHVRSLCAKTQTRSVRALVKRVAVLPPLGASGGHDARH